MADNENQTKWLFKEDSKSNTYWVGFKIDSEFLVFTDFQMGDFVDKTWHDEDIEHFLKIDKSCATDFISACRKFFGEDTVSKFVPTDENIYQEIINLFDGQKETIHRVKKILKANDISYDFQVW